MPCELSTTLYSFTEKVKVFLVPGTYTCVSCPLSLLPKLLRTHWWTFPVNTVQHYITAPRRCFLNDAPTNNVPTTNLIPTYGCFAYICVEETLAPIAPVWRQRTNWWVCPITCETTECLVQQTITSTGVRWLLRKLYTCNTQWCIMM